MEQGRNDQTDIVPVKEIKSIILRNALQSCVVTHIAQKYEVIALRILVDDEQEVFETRRLVERSLSRESHIHGFFSCLTAIKSKAYNDEDNDEILSGVGVWIFYDWPEYGTAAFENFVTKIFIDEKISVLSCKSVKPRGNYIHIIS